MDIFNFILFWQLLIPLQADPKSSCFVPGNENSPFKAGFRLSSVRYDSHMFILNGYSS